LDPSRNSRGADDRNQGALDGKLGREVVPEDRSSNSTTHTRAKLRLPQRPEPATYSGRWQANHSADRASEKPSQVPLARAGLSTAAWRDLSLTDKLEPLFGCSLNRAFEVRSWPADGLDPVRLAAQTTWGRAVLNLASKVGLEGRRPQQQKAISYPPVPRPTRGKSGRGGGGAKIGGNTAAGKQP
jgi:hypothetical protein